MKSFLQLNQQLQQNNTSSRLAKELLDKVFKIWRWSSFTLVDWEIKFAFRQKKLPIFDIYSLKIRDYFTYMNEEGTEKEFHIDESIDTWISAVVYAAKSIFSWEFMDYGVWEWMLDESEKAGWKKYIWRKITYMKRFLHSSLHCISFIGRDDVRYICHVEWGVAKSRDFYLYLNKWSKKYDLY